MSVKAFLAAVAALAMVVGFALPTPNGDKAEARSQIPTLELR
jgi:hypothetical protein